MYKLCVFLLLTICYSNFSAAQQTQIKYLSGKGKDDNVKWDFYVTKGMNSGKWTTISVPSNWELQGFGAYNYGHDEKEKGNTEKKSDEVGMYKHRFIANKSWSDKHIELVFEGVMTDTEVKLNGELVGPIHQGGFYRFQYDITKFIKPEAENLLEVNVSKISADSTVNNAEREGDFWVFGGIYRPVYLKILPQTFVQRVAINAKANGNFNMEVFAGNLNQGDDISAQVKTLKGENFGSVFKTIVSNSTDKISLAQSFSNSKLWNPEFPNLYQVEVSINRNGNIQHVFQERFGFRTVEVRKADGIYVNGTKILIKGVNRHSIWPESGRTLSRKIHLQDIELIKDMNMNAVRMSHYPPDAEFLDLCDSLGLFVLNELAGWHQKYGTSVGEKLVKEMVLKDVNHPSIILWDNGNEGGWNTDLDDDYALHDPQKRVVIHPWNNFNNIDTKHYPDFTYVENTINREVIVLHTEMIHGLYDGGHGASLDDNWNVIMKNSRHAGGFLWVLADEGVVRKDLNDSIDTDGNHAPDGIVGPHREKEGSFYTIKEVWSPVQIKKPDFNTAFIGKLEIENRYLYTNLSACKFSWQLIKYPLAKEANSNTKTLASGKFSVTAIPNSSTSTQLPIQTSWKAADALQVTAVDQYGRELYTWTWAIKTPNDIITQNLVNSKRTKQVITETQEGNNYTLNVDGIKYVFNQSTGYLAGITKSNVPISFGDGPVLAGVKQTLQSFKHQKIASNNYVVEATYTGDALLNVKWIFNAGLPVKLEYNYTQTAPAGFYGITFNIDESKIEGIKFLGDGPYRVWKNRLKGVNLNVWQKKYNNTITGETFNYPEFKGFYSNMYWAKVQAGASSFTVYTDKPNLFLQVLKPTKANTVFNINVNPTFPDGNLGFLNAIAPIGNKFRLANTMGPQSQKNEPSAGSISGVLVFDFK